MNSLEKLEETKPIIYLIEMTGKDYNEIVKMLQIVQKNRDNSRELLRQKKGGNIKVKARKSVPSSMKIVKIIN